MENFIFGKGTGISSPEEIQRRRALASAVQARNAGQTPRNMWEGLNSAADSIIGAVQNKRYDQQEAEGKASGEAAYAPIVEALKGGGKVDSATLGGAMGNDWLSGPQQGVVQALLKQNMDANQPITPYQQANLGMDQKRLDQWGQISPYQQAQIDIDQQRLAQSSRRPNDAFEMRKQQAAAAGLAETDPRYQSFILTGQMPRENAQKLTATDKNAILEADQNAQTMEGVDSALKQAEELNPAAGSGMFAGAQAWAARNDPTGFFDDKKGEATTQYSNLVMNQALSQMKAIFGGNPTEGERSVLLQLQASADKTPEERKAILAQARMMAQRRVQFNKDRASELRSGEFYQPGGGQVEDQGNQIPVGTVQDGYRYKGGNPADQNSWEPVQ